MDPAEDNKTVTHTSHTGAPLWGIPELTDGKVTGSDGWYVAGTFNGGDERGWTPITDGKTVGDLEDAIKHQKQISVALVIDRDIVDHRTVHGPIRDLDTLRLLIEREVMVHSPIG